MSDDNGRGFTYYGRTPHGVEMALNIPFDQTWDPAELVDRCALIDSLLHDRKFTRSDRLDKPAGGWGGGKGQQQRQDDPVPADLVVPEHCGQSMRYVKAREESADKKAVAAHWDCRKGRDCAEAREVGDRKFPFTDWHLTKKAANGAATTGTGAAPTTSATGEMGYGDFLTAALKEHGYGKAALLKHMHTNDDEARLLGADRWRETLAALPVKADA